MLPDSEVRVDSDDPVVAACAEFLAVWNGSWTVARCQHICMGLCHGACKDRLYSTALRIDLLQSSDVHTPSMDDWGTLGESAAKTSLGMLCHDVLARCLDIALPTWSSMLPVNDRPARGANAADNMERFRLKMQKKAWRSKKFLDNEGLRLECILTTWLASPAERLLAEVDHRDSGRNGLFDVILDTGDNPFTAFLVDVCAMLSTGSAGALGVILVYYPMEAHFEVLSRARAVGLDVVKLQGKLQSHKGHWAIGVLLIYLVIHLIFV